MPWNPNLNTRGSASDLACFMAFHPLQTYLLLEQLMCICGTWLQFWTGCECTGIACDHMWFSGCKANHMCPRSWQLFRRQGLLAGSVTLIYRLWCTCSVHCCPVPLLIGADITSCAVVTTPIARTLVYCTMLSSQRAMFILLSDGCVLMWAVVAIPIIL